MTIRFVSQQKTVFGSCPTTRWDATGGHEINNVTRCGVASRCFDGFECGLYSGMAEGDHHTMRAGQAGRARWGMCAQPGGTGLCGRRTAGG